MKGLTSGLMEAFKVNAPVEVRAPGIESLFPFLTLRPKGIVHRLPSGTGRRWHPRKRGPGRSPRDSRH